MEKKKYKTPVTIQHTVMLMVPLFSPSVDINNQSDDTQWEYGGEGNAEDALTKERNANDWDIFGE